MSTSRQDTMIMPGSEWNYEKSAAFLRWTLVVVIFLGLGFFLSLRPDAVPSVYPLFKLGIAALVISLVFQLLMGKIPLVQYHYISWIYDMVMATLLVSLTGGAFFSFAASPGIPANFFLFLYPLLILGNSIGRSWYEGLAGALVINAILGYFLLDANLAATHWNLFVLLGIINCALGLVPLFQAPDDHRNEVVTDSPMVQLTREQPPAEELPRTGLPALQKLEQEHAALSRRLAALTTLERNLGKQDNLDELFRAAVEQVMEELISPIAFLMIKKENYLDVVCGVGISEITKEVLRSRVSPDRNIITDVITNGVPIRLRVTDVPEAASFLSGAVEKIKTLLMVPVDTLDEDQPSGIFGVANGGDSGGYTLEHEELLTVLAGGTGMFIRQFKNKQEMELSYFDLVSHLAEAIESKDSYTRDHVRRVAGYSTRLARAFRLTPDEIKHIEKAAILHDIGKVATPEYILTKPGRLSDDEFAIVKEHVVNSRKLLSRISSGIDEKVKEYVASHHERWDGKGYPDGLKGDEISLGAQIIALSDTFDAMTTEKAYRKGLSHEEALANLAGSAGTQFNPKVLHRFLEMMNFDINTGKIKPGIKDTVEMSIEELQEPGNRDRNAGTVEENEK